MTRAHSHCKLANPCHPLLDSRSENRVDCRSWTKICAQNVSPESFPVFSAESAYITLTGLQHLKNVSGFKLDTYESAKTLWHYIFARSNG